jgi:hypothetical protein
MRTSSSLLKYDLQLSFYLYIYIIDIIIYGTLSFLTLSIIFKIFIYKIIYILVVSAYPYFLKLPYQRQCNLVLPQRTKLSSNMCLHIQCKCFTKNTVNIHTIGKIDPFYEYKIWYDLLALHCNIKLWV